MLTKLLLVMVGGLLALTLLAPLTGRSATSGCPTPAPTTTAMNGGAYFETSPLATTNPTQSLWFPVVHK